MKEKKPEPPVDVSEHLSLVCVCGNHGMVWIKHWQRIRCVCGRLWWALRPKRNRPMKLVPWPGNGWHPTGWE